MLTPYYTRIAKKVLETYGIINSMKTEVASVEAMMELGRRVGALCSGGEVIELVGDIGAGKTTFTKGLAMGVGVEEEVQSPTITISRVYELPRDLRLAHYDFYRLSDPGMMAAELAETVHDTQTITVVEWADVVTDILPAHTLHIAIQSPTESTRTIQITATEGRGAELLKELQ